MSSLEENQASHKETQAVPDESEGSPEECQGLPEDSQMSHEESQATPDESQASPEETEASQPTSIVVFSPYANNLKDDLDQLFQFSVPHELLLDNNNTLSIKPTIQLSARYAGDKTADHTHVAAFGLSLCTGPSITSYKDPSTGNRAKFLTTHSNSLSLRWQPSGTEEERILGYFQSLFFIPDDFNWLRERISEVIPTAMLNNDMRSIMLDERPQLTFDTGIRYRLPEGIATRKRIDLGICDGMLGGDTSFHPHGHPPPVRASLRAEARVSLSTRPEVPPLNGISIFNKEDWDEDDWTEFRKLLPPESKEE